MIAPAETASPPNVFTPSRFDVESRPLRDEPPPFLCAMVRRGYQLLSGRRGIRFVVRRLLLGRSPLAQLDLGDLEDGEELSVTGLPRVAGLRPVLEDLDLVALLVPQGLRDHHRLR